MPETKKEHPAVKSNLHPRSKHRERYDFKELIASFPPLAPFVQLNKYQDESVDYFNPEAVRALNKAILKYHYGIEYWEIPTGYLSPPVPGRADCIHHIADLLGKSNKGISTKNIPRGAQVKILDIGVGASCIYPIIGNKEYGWSFIGSDIDPISIEYANNIIENNPGLQGKVELRIQEDSKNIFEGIIKENEIIDLSMCNPPFHASPEEAESATQRKLTNLGKKKAEGPVLNFGGQASELWCEGGELGFVQRMIDQSQQYSRSCLWFTSLISKESNLKPIYEALEQVIATEVRTIEMSQGNKSSRIVAWTFLNTKQQKVWKMTRWG